MKLTNLVVALSLTTSFSAISDSNIHNPLELTKKPTLSSSASALHQTSSPWASTDVITAAPGLIGSEGPAASSDCSAFIGLTGSALVAELAQSNPQCVSPLYNLKGSEATALFSEVNMRTVAAGIRDRAVDYSGVDSTGIESLIYFQRAALYVQFYSPEDVPAYTSAVKADIKVALTNIFNNSNIWTVSEENSGVLKEALILIDSSYLGADFNHITKKGLC